MNSSTSCVFCNNDVSVKCTFCTDERFNRTPPPTLTKRRRITPSPLRCEPTSPFVPFSQSTPRRDVVCPPAPKSPRNNQFNFDLAAWSPPAGSEATQPDSPLHLDVFTPGMCTGPFVNNIPNIIEDDIQVIEETDLLPGNDIGDIMATETRFRFQGRKIGLTYSCPLSGNCAILKRHTDGCDCIHPILSAQQLADYLTSIWSGCEYCISEELHANGKRHFHAFLKWDKKHETVDAKRFDFMGVHPNIVIPRGNGDKWLSYVMKEGSSPLAAVCIYLN